MLVKPSIKAITIKKFIWLGLLFLIAMLITIAFNFRSLINEAMIDKGDTLARSVESSLTSHMLAGSYKDKQAVVQKAALIPRIENLKIIRNHSVSKQFNLPSSSQFSDDAIVKKVFNTALPNFLTPNLFESNDLLRVTYPYIASKIKQPNCMMCHKAEEGEVLAVLDFNVNMSSYLGMSLNYLYLLFSALLIAVTGISLFLARVIDKSVKEPLERLVDETQSSYKKHISIDTNRFESLELDYVATKVNQFNQIVLKQNEELIELNQEIEASQREIILAMGYIGEARSKETAQHVIRVSKLSYFLAKKLGLPEQECKWIEEAAPMHDIGKVGIPDSVLQKPGKLTDEEFSLMQQHSEWGHNVFKSSERAMLKAASVIAYQHHEYWDGKGYPQGLKGEDIHIYGRIVAIADVFDALSCRRCYKEPWPQQEVYDYFKAHSGTQFDPNLVQILLNHFDEMNAIMVQNKD